MVRRVPERVGEDVENVEDKEVVEQWADDCVAMFAKQEGLLLRLAREQEK